MNNRVAVLRRAIEQLIQILTDKNIPVTQRGTSAYVESDRRTNEPVRVNLPYVPDDASDEFIAALHGFLDHEGGHLLFTDFAVITEANKGGKRLANMHNIIEDTYVERKMCERFLGCAENIDHVQKFFLSKYSDPNIKEALSNGDVKRAVGTMMIPALRALAGQEVFEKYMNENDYWELMKPIIDKINHADPDLLARIPTIENSKEALDIARAIDEAIKENNDGCAEGDESDGDGGKEGEEGESDESSSPSEDPGSEDANEDSPDEDDSDEQVEGSSSKNATDEESGEDEDEESGEGEESGEDEESGEGQGEDGESSDGDDGDGENADENTEGEEGNQAGGGKGAPPGLPPEIEGGMDNIPDFDKAVAESLSDDSYDMSKVAKYLPYTKDYDVIEPLKIGYDYNDSFLVALEDAAAEAVGPLQKTLERLILAQSKRRWQGGLRSGRINPGALYRLKTSDDRVFRKREISKTKDVAMSLVVDNSGSMDGKPMTTAMVSAYAMSLALDRINVKHEIIGFTTLDSRLTADDARAIARDEKSMGRGFSRYSPIYMPIYKAFNEKLGITQKKRIAYASARQKFLHHNIDGESVEYAAQRLMAQREPGKIMCVLSDGNPAGYGNRREMEAHLKSVVKDLNKRGVQTFGIGIDDASVKRYYDHCVVLSDVNQLPGEIMRDLKKFLLG